MSSDSSPPPSSKQSSSDSPDADPVVETDAPDSEPQRDPELDRDLSMLSQPPGPADYDEEFPPDSRPSYVEVVAQVAQALNIRVLIGSHAIKIRTVFLLSLTAACTLVGLAVYALVESADEVAQTFVAPSASAPTTPVLASASAAPASPSASASPAHPAPSAPAWEQLAARPAGELTAAELARVARGEAMEGEQLLLAKAMTPGPDGPDQLFLVWSSGTAGPTTIRLAKRLLFAKDVRPRASRALGVTLDLIEAGTDCEKVQSILPRVVEHGDRRALRPLTELKRKRGCGPKQKRDCFKCLRRDRNYQRALKAAKGREAPAAH